VDAETPQQQLALRLASNVLAKCEQDDDRAHARAYVPALMLLLLLLLLLVMLAVVVLLITKNVLKTSLAALVQDPLQAYSAS
jgi:hypothetical protein